MEAGKQEEGCRVSWSTHLLSLWQLGRQEAGLGRSEQDGLARGRKHWGHLRGRERTDPTTGSHRRTPVLPIEESCLFLHTEISREDKGGLDILPLTRTSVPLRGGETTVI